MIRAVAQPIDAGSKGNRRTSINWRPDRVIERLEGQPADFVASFAAGSTAAHVTDCVAQALPETPTRIAQIKADLKRAGDYRPLAYQKLATVRYVGLMGSLIVFGTLTVLASPRAEPWCVLALSLGMLASWWLPLWRLRRRAAWRIDEIEAAIPDLLDLLNVCLSHNLTVPDALALASHELHLIHPAIGEELSIVCRQAELESLDKALEAFEERLDLPEIRSLVSRLLQVDATQAR